MVLLLMLLAAAAGSGEDWPNWRGPNHDGISRETGIPATWGAGGLEELWRVELGSGFSSFAAVEGRLYTLAERDGRQRAVALDGRTGKTLWSHDLERGYMERQGGDGPRATPAVRDGLVYVLGALGTLAALEAGDGKPRWSLNLLETFGAENLTWGVSGSPLIEGDLVIAAVGAQGAPLAALDRKSGKTVWRAQSDEPAGLAGYSTPVAVTHAGKRQIITFLGRCVAGLEAATGERLWSFPWETSFDVNAAAPIYHQGRLFISSGYNTGCALLDLTGLSAADGQGPQVVWQSKVLRNKFSSCVLFEGNLFGFDENRLKCVEFLTGKERWRQAGLGHGTLLIARGRIIALGDAGDLVSAPASPEGYRETGRMDGVLRAEPCWTVPVLHRGVLYLRDLKQAVALRLAAD